MAITKTINHVLYLGFLLLGTATLSAQTYQLVATGPPVIESKAPDVQLRFLPNNQLEYAISQGQWRGWTLVYEWGPPQVTYQPDGQLLSIPTKGWIVNAGPPQRGATIGVTFRGLTDGARRLSEGRAFAGFSPSENRYVNNNGAAQIKMTDRDEPEIIATVYVTDQAGTTVTLATYTFRRTDLSSTSAVTLYTPKITPNILDEGAYWMGIRATGWLDGLQGSTVQLVTRFYYQNESPLRAPESENVYSDVDGFVATATQPFQVAAPRVDLTERAMYIPYSALNLPNTGGQATYELVLFVDVFVDGKLRKQSQRVPFTVKW